MSVRLMDTNGIMERPAPSQLFLLSRLFLPLPLCILSLPLLSCFPYVSYFLSFLPSFPSDGIFLFPLLLRVCCLPVFSIPFFQCSPILSFFVTSYLFCSSSVLPSFTVSYSFLRYFLPLLFLTCSSLALSSISFFLRYFYLLCFSSVSPFLFSSRYLLPFPSLPFVRSFLFAFILSSLYIITYLFPLILFSFLFYSFLLLHFFFVAFVSHSFFLVFIKCLLFSFFYFHSFFRYLILSCFFLCMYFLYV